MIAVQLSAFKLDDNNIVLHPVTVLDVVEEIADIDAVDEVERADRPSWDKKAEPSSLAILDKIVSLLRTNNIDPKLTYNRYHISIGTTGYNFCWFHPRKSVGYCHIEFRLPPEMRDEAVAALQAKGVDASPIRKDIVAFTIAAKGVEDNSSALLGFLQRAEEFSRR
jgi:hypothetical protein